MLIGKTMSIMVGKTMSIMVGKTMSIMVGKTMSIMVGLSGFPILIALLVTLSVVDQTTTLLKVFCNVVTMAVHSQQKDYFNYLKGLYYNG